MSKGIYIGIDNAARKVLSAYVGIDGVARRIKKAYVGVGGVARPCLTSGPVEYYGAIPALDSAKRGQVSVNAGNYVLFGGGNGGPTSPTTYVDGVDAYDASLVHSSCTALSVARSNLAAASVGGFAIFAGGRSSSTSGTVTVDAYNNSHTMVAASNLSQGRYNLAGASVGNYALFAGGQYYNTSSRSTDDSDAVEAYNGSLTKTSLSYLVIGRWSLGGASVGNYALFAGGYAGAVSDMKRAVTLVNAYDSNLTSSVSVCSARMNSVAISSQKYALFAGGNNGYEANYIRQLSVDAYDEALTRCPIDDLSAYAYSLTSPGACTNEYKVLARSGTIEIYDENLVHSLITGTTWPTQAAAGSVGDYIVVAGGVECSSAYAILTMQEE